jgi:thiamine biosynthesis lipoprotein
MNRLTLIRYIAFAFAGILSTSCAQKEYYEEKGSIFHTFYQIKYEAPTWLTEKIDAQLQAFSLSLNPYNPNSILAKVNRNEEVEVDEWFETVFNKAMEVSVRSEGAFDVTAAPLFSLWGFGVDQSEHASPKKIDSILAFVGYEKVHLENKHVRKDDPRIKLDFSAIAKGYACDVIATLLEQEGVENYLINIGGEITVKGRNPAGLCWQLGINKPEDDTTGLVSEIANTVRLCSKSGMATSGNYRNYYIKEGKKYTHTIDPHTGHMSQQTILSATIIASDCMTADAYATAFMSMGVEAACRMAKNIPEIEYLIIYNDGTTTHYQTKTSPGMQSLLK